MRYLVVAIIGIALFAAGFLAADMVQSDADAQGTWHVEYMSNDEYTSLMDLRGFLESLPADCSVDIEQVSRDFTVAYSCPD